MSKGAEKGAVRQLGKLQEELERLKLISKQGLALRVVWNPRNDGSLSGEVKENVIYIYESDEGKALDALEHEFIDYLVTLTIEPYKLVTNNLIKSINRIAYVQKETVIESIRALLGTRVGEDGNRKVGK